MSRLLSRVFLSPLPSEKEKKPKTTQTSDQHKPCSFPRYKIPNFPFSMIWLMNSNSHILGCSKGRLTAYEWTLLANKGAQLHLRALITGVPLHQTMRIVVGIFFFFFLLAKWRSYNWKIKGVRASRGISHAVLFSWIRIHFPLTMRHRPKNKNKTTFIQYRQVN